MISKRPESLTGRVVIATINVGLLASTSTLVSCGGDGPTPITVADPTTSTIAAASTTIPADGVSTSTITVQLKGSGGTNLIASGGTVTLATTAGTLSSVTDHNDGTYTATLTATTAAGLATITGMVNASFITDNATVVFGPDPATSTITAAPTTIQTAGAKTTSTITVQLKDGNGTNLNIGGDNVTLATTLGTLSSVTDNNDGTYTAVLTAGTPPGTATITGTVSGTAITDNATVVINQVADPATSTITAAPTTIQTAGTTRSSTITVQLKDSGDTNVASGGNRVALATTRGTLGSVTDNNDGTYTATLTASTSPGTATITGSLDGTAITDDATVTISQVADPAASTITASPTSIPADGASTSTITVQLKDGNGTNLDVGEDNVTLFTTLGTLGSVTDNNDGSYTATLTAGTSSGTASIMGTVNGTAITGGASVTVVGSFVTWTWVSGSTTSNQRGVYGSKGVASGSNLPGAREGAASWIDASGNFWLFGGNGRDFAGRAGRLNDLWRFDGTNWTWVSGSNAYNQPGVYGTQGVASGANIPGAHAYGASWIDASGNFWLFGGEGSDAAGSFGRLNDLWRFDGINWTWVSGSNSIDQGGVYGTQGIASGSNAPGARSFLGASWIDASGNLWLFGGFGHDTAGLPGDLNDLWRFDGTNWTWVSGSNSIDQGGVYGTKGVASGSNIPGARAAGASWLDASGNFWLFGGTGFRAAGSLSRFLNDLWRFDGTNWTWVSGSNSIDQGGVYGTQGVASGSNIPGARRDGASWMDANGNLWLFGGFGYDAARIVGRLNDLWCFDGTNWIWVSGSNARNQPGVYGTQGVASGSNIPGAREGAASWMDASGNLWLFGGGNVGGGFNDLWRARPGN